MKAGGIFFAGCLAMWVQAQSSGAQFLDTEASAKAVSALEQEIYFCRLHAHGCGLLMEDSMKMTWEELESTCLQCRKCGLCEKRTNVVFGVGSRSADVMFIGEGPGENEDLQGEPFVGRAGQLLDKMLAAVDLDRHTNIYIANIVKCRPPKNRDPEPDEQDACLPWLRSQVALVRPKIIVCLGRVAAMKLLKPDIKITKEHGEFYERNGVLMMATLHPAALLRNPNNKPAAFEDFLKLRKKLDELHLAPAPGDLPF